MFFLLNFQNFFLIILFQLILIRKLSENEVKLLILICFFFVFYYDLQNADNLNIRAWGQNFYTIDIDEANSFQIGARVLTYGL